MDCLAVDLGPDTDIRVGEEVVLIGTSGSERILVEEVAKRNDTINYEIVCALSDRVERSYLRREAAPKANSD
jgi:alanine racemase